VLADATKFGETVFAHRLTRSDQRAGDGCSTPCADRSAPGRGQRRGDRRL